MLVDDGKVIEEIKKQSGLYETARVELKKRIKSKFKKVKEKLNEVEKELLSKVETKLGGNPFANFLTKNDLRNPPTDTEVRSILRIKIPRDPGPDDEFFLSICEKIEALKTWSPKEMKMSSPFAPYNVRATVINWDSITLTWDVVEGMSSYQIEVDGSESLDNVTTNTFTKRGLFPDTEHTFRVRAVYENGLKSEWSYALNVSTQKRSFEEWVWKECPDGVKSWRKYVVSENNPRIAANMGGIGNYCTIIGNTPIPLGIVTSWYIKVLKSRNNSGDFFVGVAPFDINQNEDDNYYKSGWYFGCHYSTLCSGPPHDCRDKRYGPRKGEGEYIHAGSSVGVVMDTARGGLSFVVNGVDFGVAYEGIPLDKPLVPCVLLCCEGYSVELVI